MFRCAQDHKRKGGTHAQSCADAHLICQTSVLCMWKSSFNRWCQLPLFLPNPCSSLCRFGSGFPISVVSVVVVVLDNHVCSKLGKKHLAPFAGSVSHMSAVGNNVITLRRRFVCEKDRGLLGRAGLVNYKLDLWWIFCAWALVLTCLDLSLARNDGFT